MARIEPTEQRDATTARYERSVESGPQPLSEVERKILDFMVQYLRSNTYQPSIREIGERFGIKSTKTVSEHLQALANKGHLERDPSRSRGVRILGMNLDAQTISVPCFTAPPADRAGLRSDRAEMHLSIDRRLAGSKGAFFLRARAGELATLGVTSGDFVLVQPASIDELEDGAIVVAHVTNESWYHRFTRNGSGVRLESLQAGQEVTSVHDPETLFCLGRVTGLYRRMDEAASAVNLTPH